MGAVDRDSGDNAVDDLQTVTAESAPDKAPFNELLRVDIDERRDLVGSLIDGGETLWLNEYIKQGSYVGFTHGVGIGIKEIGAFIGNSEATIMTGMVTYVSWKGVGKSKIAIQRVGDSVIDVRQFVESQKYTGFTRRGFRINKDKYSEFLTKLKSLV